jgi:hypothetical protein
VTDGCEESADESLAALVAALGRQVSADGSHDALAALLLSEADRQSGGVIPAADFQEVRVRFFCGSLCANVMKAQSVLAPTVELVVDS